MKHSRTFYLDRMTKSRGVYLEVRHPGDSDSEAINKCLISGNVYISRRLLGNPMPQRVTITVEESNANNSGPND